MGARSGPNGRNTGADASGQRRAAGGGAPGGQGGHSVQQPYDRSDPAVRVEREALKLAVQVPALCGPTFDALEATAFTAGAHVMVAALIVRCGGVAGAGRPRDWAARLIEEAPDDHARAFLRELAVEQVQVAGEPDEAYVDIILARVGELAIGRQITAVKARLQRMNPVEEQGEYNRLFGDLMALEQRRQALLRRLTGG
jgi:DNA primase